MKHIFFSSILIKHLLLLKASKNAKVILFTICSNAVFICAAFMDIDSYAVFWGNPEEVGF